MSHSTPKRWRWIRSFLMFSSVAAIAWMPGTTRAQQSAGQASSSARHPVAIARPANPRPVVMMQPVRSGASAPTSRAAQVTPRRMWPASNVRAASAPSGVRVAPVELLSSRDPARSIFETPGFVAPFFLSAPFPGSFGVPGSVSRFDALPLGFGLWPACDSAATPGVFWTVGPCFGVGSYSEELASPAGNGYVLGTTPAPAYPLPLGFLIEPGAEPGAAAGRSNLVPVPAPAMLLYSTDGKTVAASDWWVAHGRLQYITQDGATGSMDLSQLDLEQTIKQNQKRGLEFHLNFTPPAQRSSPTELP